ncbi:hypothetical protein F4780DRAFT_740314 [Xylariomycetidae sp. FL0641]|nr:hypothetical protein F4780DRAFT_740314 [Xylariomycetidae sp. FL0641]
MAPVQNTFSIIPNAPSAINATHDATAAARPSRPPMTTKQAKKAYQKSNKGPKLSKAEQRKQELFEQDRIRREFEKEKNQARARAARDKKKEKQDQEKKEKKRKGLPLVEVHPSQDTITWFVRSKPKASTREPSPGVQPPTLSPQLSKEAQVVKEDSDDASSYTEDELEPPSKKRRKESTSPAASRPTEETLEPRPLTSPDDEAGEEEHQPSKVAAEGHPRDDLGVAAADAPMAASDHDTDATEDDSVEDELLDDLVRAVDSQCQNSNPLEASHSSKPPPLRDPEISSNSHPTHVEPTLSKQTSPAILQHTPQPPMRQPLQEISKPLSNPNSTNATDSQRHPNNGKARSPPRPTTASAGNLSQKQMGPAPRPPPFRQPKTPMGPPPVPPKFRSPKPDLESKPRTPHFINKQLDGPVRSVSAEKSNGKLVLSRSPQTEYLPTSTQLLGLGELEDFFPSASQEVRELFEEPETKSPSRPMGTRPIEVSHDPSPLAKHLSPASGHPVSKPQNPFAQVTRKASASTFKGNSISSIGACVTTVSPTSDRAPMAGSGAWDVPFFSTQDLFLSSQDMKDLEEEPPSPVLARTNTRGESAKSQGQDGGQNSPDDHSPPQPPTKKPDQQPKIRDNSKNAQLVESTQLAAHDPINQYKEHPRIVQNSGTNAKTSMGSHASVKQVQQDSGTGISSHNRKAGSKSKETPSRQPSKPFFTSSGSEMRYKYAIERSKTAAWEDANARRKAQEQLDQIQELEDQRVLELLGSDKELLNTAELELGTCSPRPCVVEGGLPDTTAGSEPSPLPLPPPSKPENRHKSSSAAKQPSSSGSENQKSRKRNPGNAPGSSYQRMLDLLGQSKNQTPTWDKPGLSHDQGAPQEPLVPASQETDYGDDDLFDVL